LTRPISASVLIALLLTPLIQPDAPYSVRQLALATLIVPMLRIVTLYFDRTAWPQLFSLIGLFFVERILSALSMELLVQRLVLLTLSIATTALFFWARRSGLEKHLGLEEPARLWAKRLFTVSLVASGVAVLLNLFGNLTLALVIQSAVVRCVLLAASLRAMVVVVREVGRLVAHAFERRGWRAVANNRAAMMRRLDTWTVVLGSAIWIYYTLTMLRLDEIVVASVTSVLSAEAKIGAVTLSLSSVLVSIAAIWIAVRVSGITRALLNDDVLPRFPLPRGVPNAISVLVNYTILLFGFLLGAGMLGISLSSLTIIMGALGVGIGFGLQNIVNNFVSGLILVFERPVQVGDAVQFNQLSGVVTQIGFRASRIRTYSGSEVIVPNGDLISGHLVNWTLSDRRRRLELPVTVAYGSDCDLVEHTLLDVVRANKEVMVDPPPLAILENFGASAIEFKVYCWIADYDMGLRVRNQLNHAMVHALAEKGIEVPGARREVYMMPPRA
jgi:small-conductance mechanosensitive channel